MKHCESISVEIWPLGERLVSLALAICICTAACAAVLLVSEIFGRTVLLSVAIAAASAIREDAADVWDSIKQLVLPIATTRLS